MGVHISFVRSTNLDSWQLNQLRTMKVGGNASATDFFNKHGGASLLTDSDTKKKYSSRVSELYKEELARRAKEDAVVFPDGIFVDGMETVKPAAETTASAGDDEDFFSSWDKPSASSKTTSAPSSKPSTPLGISRNASTSSATSAAPRTVTSSSLRSNTTATSTRPSKLGAARLGSTTTTTNTGSSAASNAAATKKTKPGGLGAKKAAAVDFAEAERKAQEEAERVKQLGYDREREEVEERARQEAASLELKSRAASSVGKSVATKVATPPKPNGSNQDMERLGMGMKRLGFGSVPSGTSSIAAGSVSKTRAAPEGGDAPTTARDRFGNQKAISSDMYFNRGSYDPQSVAEGQARLAQFSGATSISSSQYFGRDEEEELAIARADTSLLGDGSLAGLENAARDAVARVMSNPDVQNLGESIRTGALKLSDYLAQMGER